MDKQDYEYYDLVDALAVCRNSADPDLFMSESGVVDLETRKAKALCATCPIVGQCLDYAINTRKIYGVWGGATVAERKYLKRYPHAKERFLFLLGRSGGKTDLPRQGSRTPRKVNQNG